MKKYSFQYLLVVLSESCKKSDQQTTFEHDHFFHRTIADNSVKLKHMFFEKGFVDAVRNDLRYLLQIKKIVLRIWYENRQIMEETKLSFSLPYSQKRLYFKSRYTHYITFWVDSALYKYIIKSTLPKPIFIYE